MQKVLLVAALLVLGGGLALAQTTVDLNWDVVGGNIKIDFNAGDDAYAGLLTGGSYIFGEFHGIDYDNNPYNYNVDTVRAKVRANIDGGGYVEFIMERQDSWEPMYGPEGQATYTYLETSGTGFFATNTRTNYADMITHNYGFQNDNQWSASGDYFRILHYIRAGNPDYSAGFYARGTGSIDVTLMSSEARGASSWRFGEGAGCYLNAHAEGTGSGAFGLWGAAPTELHAFGATIGGGSVALEILYNNGFSTANNLNMSGH